MGLWLVRDTIAPAEEWVQSWYADDLVTLLVLAGKKISYFASPRAKICAKQGILVLRYGRSSRSARFAGAG